MYAISRKDEIFHDGVKNFHTGKSSDLAKINSQYMEQLIEGGTMMKIIKHCIAVSLLFFFSVLASAVAQTTEVTIDVKPGSDLNPINPQKGTITVAIITDTEFDATEVDPMTVEFGPDNATEKHDRGHIEDVDDDGDLDLVLHFKAKETGIECGDTYVELFGETFEAELIQGSDDIITLGKSCQETNNTKRYKKSKK